MKIVVAADSFKGSLSANRVCQAITDALLALDPSLAITQVPMADGGEGTVHALLSGKPGGETIQVDDVQGPLPDQRVGATYAWWPGEQSAAIEVASASGLPLVPEALRDPLMASSYGTGQLIQHAVERDARRIFLGLGGSATVDGGLGMLSALGWGFLDGAGRELSPCGASLERIEHINPSARDACDISAIEVIGLSDV
ncbi:MAG: glycerate kinase, partial [Deltaproteobacteria bacterium]|nr:glycerate kinase [Deltaproteobacteria bacterium]